MTAPAETPARTGGSLTIFLCFLAALLEGADIVSMGLAAPSVAREFGFAVGQVSYILTAAIVGLMAGAAIGGRMGDRIGRKRVLVIAFFVLAVFSLLTAHATDFGQFIAIRFLCGLMSNPFASKSLISFWLCDTTTAMSVVRMVSICASITGLSSGAAIVSEASSVA